MLFPRCAVRGRPATRHDHCANLRSWFGMVFACSTCWSAFTLLVLLALWSLPVGGPPAERLCLPPWTFIAVRAGWTTVQAVLVAAGAYIHWCTRGEHPQGVDALPVVTATKAVLGGSLREPLTPISPTADFVAVN